MSMWIELTETQIEQPWCMSIWLKKQQSILLVADHMSWNIVNSRPLEIVKVNGFCAPPQVQLEYWQVEFIADTNFHQS